MVLIWGSVVIARPWIGWLDTWVADGDRRLLELVVVGWCWLLLVPVVLATEVRRRRGAWSAAPLWALLVLAALPMLAFMPSRGSGSDRGEDLAQEVLADFSVGSDLAWVAMGLLLSLPMLVAAASGAGAGVREPQGPVRRWRTTVVVWTLVWGAGATLVWFTVESYGSRGDWLATSAQELAGPGEGSEAVTSDFQVGLAPSRAAVVSCEEAAQALAVDGGSPSLEGCRSALLVEAVGRVGSDTDRRDTGSLVAVVLQTRTERALNQLDDDLDDVELVPGAGLPEPPGDTLATPARAALALVIAAEDPGEAPTGDDPASAEARPLTRALAYVLIGTSQGFYPAPPEVPQG
ncbi:hypothetical protein [Nocardioides nanhaiensis]|uniref:Uncharacterized protein n=1 Tax=Nocardioides nanhaiensis TaxID=1476871 RepID=A0ABP8VSI9_9ACTN